MFSTGYNKVRWDIIKEKARKQANSAPPEGSDTTQALFMQENYPNLVFNFDNN
jgi:hypothetical protein